MGLSTAAEVNDYMKTRSYVEGYAFSAKDVEVFGKIGLPDQKQHPHAYRWYVHTAALSGSKCLALVAGGAGSKPTPAPAKAAAPKKAAPAKPAPAAAAEEEDDDDFWGDDEEQTEEEKAQAAKELEEAKAKAMAKLAKKEANQRSLCNLEIKPWEADQDLKALYAKIKKTVVKDGLKWSEGLKLVDVAFGVQKIICTAVVNQTLSMDAIIEEITEDLFADEVQSMSMTSMSLL
jgi:translation elongation factor EF-1beta